MLAAIASIHERMAKGGDWREFREEIATLHNAATTEAEHIILLEAFHNLTLVGEHAFDAETWDKILPITRAEYLNFLNKESLEDGTVNPAILSRITAREIEAGRMDPDDDFRSFAQAGGTILGDSAGLTTHHCRPGNMLFIGSVLGSVGALFLGYIDRSPLWGVVIGLAIGWILNERESRRIKSQVFERRSLRQANG